MKSCIKGLIIAIILIVVVSSIYKRTRFYYNEPLFLPFSNRLNADKLYLQVGDTYKLRPQAINKRVSYQSSNFRIVDVFPLGRVCAKAVGTAIITAEFSNGKSYCKITVIDINYRELYLKVGEQATLVIKGTGKDVCWESSNKHVKVTSKGVVTACSVGRATITAEIAGKCLECNVYVKNNN